MRSYYPTTSTYPNFPHQAIYRPSFPPSLLNNIAISKSNKAMKPTQIPRRIDDPPHLLLWSLDEIVPTLLGLVIGMMLGKALICLLIGLLITNLYKRFRDNHPDGYLLHLLYWGGFLMNPSLLTRQKPLSLKNPFIRRYWP